MASALIEINPPSPEARRLWAKVLELAEILGESDPWILIGGLMVQLHGFEHGVALRSTVDIDLLGDSRRRPEMTVQIAEALADRGAEMQVPPVGEQKLGYKFELDGEVVEVLGSDGVRRDPKTIGRYVTFQVPGGTQALRRAETVHVSLGGAPGIAVRRPNLLGAILIKSRALVEKRRAKFESDRQDLIRLLSFVEDPRAIATSGDLTKKEGRWLQEVDPMLGFGDSGLLGAFSHDEVIAAEQAFRLLTNHSLR